MRSIVDGDGVRSVSVFGEPVVGEENVRDSPAAHDLLTAAGKIAKGDAVEVGTRLLQVFGSLRRFVDRDWDGPVCPFAAIRYWCRRSRGTSDLSQTIEWWMEHFSTSVLKFAPGLRPIRTD